MKTKVDPIEEALDAEDWQKARALIEQQLEDEPDNHWLLTRLGTTYYEEKDYKTALQLHQKALELQPNCPLVTWDYAGSLDMLGNSDEAIAVWARLLDRGEESVAHDECGEGLPWARSLLNDCRYRIGLAQMNKGNPSEALKWIDDYLRHRSSKSSSIYTKDEVLRKEAEVKQAVKAGSRSSK